MYWSLDSPQAIPSMDIESTMFHLILVLSAFTLYWIEMKDF